MQYFTYAKSGLPYMGVGRNLLYKKSLFLAVNGFSSHQHLPSGDDDLLISDAANGSNTAVCLDDRTFVFSDAKLTQRLSLHQKIKTYHYVCALSTKNSVLFGPVCDGTIDGLFDFDDILGNK
ncbi:MAG: hypothetical protein IPO94_03465 [Saprospiraceae bacterium]|nr:hypothetical protein [Saprospiraceae bacterium]